mmetsp:Transcript_42284/g.136676  ORF Transcript_42284/g.136676 Transcript_42284/m.136676 type:complete len:293 (+) Transcript_42284:671-1549(+)
MIEPDALLRLRVQQLKVAQQLLAHEMRDDLLAIRRQGLEGKDLVPHVDLEADGEQRVAVEGPDVDQQKASPLHQDGGPPQQHVHAQVQRRSLLEVIAVGGHAFVARLSLGPPPALLNRPGRRRCVQSEPRHGVQDQVGQIRKPIPVDFLLQDVTCPKVRPSALAQTPQKNGRAPMCDHALGELRDDRLLLLPGRPGVHAKARRHRPLRALVEALLPRETFALSTPECQNAVLLDSACERPQEASPPPPIRSVAPSTRHIVALRWTWQQKLKEQAHNGGKHHNLFPLTSTKTP